MTDAFMPLLRHGFDPVAELAERRRDEPVTKLEFPFGISAWLLTRYADVKQVLADPTGYSNDFARVTEAVVGGQTPTVDPGGLGFADPPDHTRLRKLLTPEFTVRRLARSAAPHRTDRRRAAGRARRGRRSPADLVEEFAMPIPSLVMCELLGVPYSDRGDFQKLSASRFDIFANLDNPMGAISESLKYLKGLVQKERANPERRVDRSHRRQPGRRHHRRRDGRSGRWFAHRRGHETTASMLALGSLVLMQRPDLAEALRSEFDRREAVARSASRPRPSSRNCSAT